MAKLTEIWKFLKSPLGVSLIVPASMTLLSLIVPAIDQIPAKFLFGFSVGLIGLIVPFQYSFLRIYEDTKDQFIKLQEDTKELYKNTKSCQEESKNFVFYALKQYIGSKSNSSEIFQHIVDKSHDEFIYSLRSLADGFLRLGHGNLYTGDMVASSADSIALARKKILAVETGQTPEKWLTNPRFQSYNNENIQARNRGVLIERIWIIKRGTEHRYKAIWKNHTEEGIKCYYVCEEDIHDNLRSTDFCIIDDEIVYEANVYFMQNGERKYNGGLISIRPDDVQRLKSRYQSLFRDKSDIPE
jgi:hypothetical protein